MKKATLLFTLVGLFTVPCYGQETTEPKETPEVSKETPSEPVKTNTDESTKEITVGTSTVTEQEIKALEILKRADQKEKIRNAENKLKAKSNFEHGLALYNKGMYEQALDSLNKALEFDPHHEEAKLYLLNTEKNLGKRLGDVGAASKNLSDITSVKKTEKLIEIRNRIEKAQNLQKQSEIISKQNPNLVSIENKLDLRIKALNEALEEYRKTKEMLQWVEIGPDKIAEFSSIIAAEEKNIHIEKMNILKELSDVKKDRSIKDAENQVALEKELSEKRIESMLDAAKEAYGRGSYVQCQKICREIIKIDPINSSAIRLRDKARGRQFKLNEKYIEKNYEEEYKRWEENNLRDMIPWTDPLVYSEDWESEISGRSAVKNRVKRVSAWESRLLGILDQKGTFDWQQVPLADVINEIRENFPDLPIHLQKQALESAGITDQDPVDLKVTDLPLKHILKLLLSQFNLTYGLVDQTLIISDEKGVMGELTLERYDVRDLTVTISDFPGPDVSLTNATGIGGDSGLGDLLGGGDVQIDPVTADQISELIKSKVYQNSWSDDRGTSIVVNNGNLLVTQSHDMHLLVEDFLTRLRRTRATQVSVNTRIIRSNKSNFENIGVNWEGLDQATLSDAGLANRQAGFLSDVTKLDDTDLRAGVFTGTPVAANRSNGFLGQFAVLGNTQYEAVLAALETKTSLNTLTAPRILVYNNQLAHIAIIEEQSYISDYSVSDGVYDPTVTSFFHGVVLEVRPTISSNRKYITLQLSPTIRDLLGLDPIDSVSALNSGFSLSAETPIVQTIAVQTTVAIPDRGVMIIGALADISERKESSGVPILSKIPLLGRLFRRDTTSVDKENVLLLVNAEIILLEEIEENL